MSSESAIAADCVEQAPTPRLRIRRPSYVPTRHLDLRWVASGPVVMIDGLVDVDVTVPNGQGLTGRGHDVDGGGR